MSIYIYILVMAVTTYLIRMIPLAVFRRDIKSRFFRSFLAYVPVCCLAAMTFPAIFYSTNSVISGITALAAALIAALLKRSLVTVAAVSCVAVFLTELIIKII